MNNHSIIRALLPIFWLIILTAGCRPEFTDGDCSAAEDCFPGESCIEGQCVPGSSLNNTNNQNNLPDMSEDTGGDEGNNNNPDMAEEVGSVVVTPPTATLDLTETTTFAAQPKSISGMDLDRPVTWATSDPSIATVTNVGEVTAVSVGVATITATSEGVDGTATVTVEKKPVATVVLAPDATSLGLGNSVQLAVTISDANGDELFGRDITFASSDTGIATVLSDGTVTAEAVGVATITASVEGIDGTSVITVVPDPVDRVEVTPATVQIEVIEVTQLTGQTFDVNNTELIGRAITWTSSDDTVATVATDGQVTGVAVGTATITGSSEGKMDTSVVTVIQRPVASVVVTPTSADLVASNTEQLTAETRAADNTDLMRAVTWMSSDTGVATVDTTGLVTAVGEGTATITATSEGIDGTATINVAPPVASVAVSPATATLDPTDTQQLFATPKDAGGNDLAGRDTAMWMSSNTGVATVDATGMVTAVGPGTATITATIEGIGGTATITVREPVASVEVSPASPQVVAASTQQMTATPKDGGGNDLAGRDTATWMTSNASVALVSATGLVTGVSAGTATVSATVEGVTGNTTVTVLAQIASVDVSSTAAGADVGGTVTFTAVPRDSGGNALTGRTCTFSSMATGVATVVPATGVATVTGEGDTSIVATCESATGSETIAGYGAVASVTVTPGPTSTLTHPGTLQFSATLQDSSGHTLTGRTTTWMSSTVATATIDAAGLATSVVAGTTTITATSEGVPGTSALTVN